MRVAGDAHRRASAGVVPDRLGDALLVPDWTASPVRDDELGPAERDGFDRRQA